jgi:hypothetical protein
MRRLRWAAALVGGTMLVAGCGDTPRYQARAVEAYLVTSQRPAFSGGAQVEKAKCPADLELREGMSFVCTLTVSGAELPYRVRLTQVHAPRSLTVRARPDGVLFSKDRVTEFVAKKLPRSAQGSVVDCGGEYFVAKVGSTVDCMLRLGSQHDPLELKVLDEAGRLSTGS